MTQLKTIEPKQIVDIARTYVGTPWHHAARKKGVGIDCAGLLMCVSHELGVPVEDTVNYTDGDEFELMTSTLSRYCRLLPENEPLQAGDILVFRARQMYNHCGFFSGEKTIIHAYNTPGVGRVVETPYDESWEQRLAHAYRYMGATETN